MGHEFSGALHGDQHWIVEKIGGDMPHITKKAMSQVKQNHRG
jgi:hypothetical protein